MEYIKRIARGFDVNSDTLATEVIHAVGPAGNFLSEPHTVENFRRELFLPTDIWTRQAWDDWETKGRKSMAERLRDRVEHTLTSYEVEPLDSDLTKEIDNIVECARRDFE